MYSMMHSQTRVCHLGPGLEASVDSDMFWNVNKTHGCKMDKKRHLSILQATQSHIYGWGLDLPSHLKYMGKKSRFLPKKCTITKWLKYSGQSNIIMQLGHCPGPCSVRIHNAAYHHRDLPQRPARSRWSI